MTLPERLERLERALLLRALRTSQGCRRDAARALGIPERTLHAKLHAYGLAADLAALAALHGWPARTERATAARRRA
jgi:DNA-binding NtrC family response regulator